MVIGGVCGTVGTLCESYVVHSAHAAHPSRDHHRDPRALYPVARGLATFLSPPRGRGLCVSFLSLSLSLSLSFSRVWLLFNYILAALSIALFIALSLIAMRDAGIHGMQRWNRNGECFVFLLFFLFFLSFLSFFFYLASHNRGGINRAGGSRDK